VTINIVSKWLAELGGRVGLEGWSLLQLARVGDLRPVPAHRLAAMLRAVSDYGILGAATRITALRDPNGVALIDERGALSFTDLDMRSNALANAWRRRGLSRGAGVAILARNHRGLLDAVYATAKCGGRIILLNTGFGGAETADVVVREGVDLLIHDDEYGDAVADIEPRLGRLRAWSERPGWDTLDALIERGDTAPPPRSGGRPKIIILTSGTTGTPKGACHSEPYSLIPVGGLLDKVPFRAREVTECCVPLFHSLGFSYRAFALV